MKIFELFSEEDFKQMHSGNLISIRPHASGELFIANYTNTARCGRVWNDVTMACRGLIYDSDYNIIARPYKKFFNLGEGSLLIDWDSPVEVTDKMDGSLGILYHYDGKWAIATRGSFNSDQAIFATQLLNTKYKDYVDNLIPDDFTYMFEIVYPGNRIVLDYGDVSDLFLLGAVNKQYGFYVGPSAAAFIDWPGPRTKVFEYKTLQAAFSADPRPNAEGYVVRSGSQLVKIKQADYIELHKIIFDLNKISIWQSWCDNKVEELLESLPEEFHSMVKDVTDELSSKLKDICDQAIADFSAIYVKGMSRKDFALLAVQKDNSDLLFAMLDGREIIPVIKRNLKPRMDNVQKSLAQT